LKIENCNRCRYCNRKLSGLTPCICCEDKDNQIIWDERMRANKEREKKRKVTKK